MREINSLCSGSRSIESVQQRSTNPLLRAGLVTEAVARKMSSQVTCEEYLAMTEEEISEMLLSSGIRQQSVNACLNKRKQFISKKV